MADQADLAQQQAEIDEAMAPRRPPYVLPPGVPGDCELCGEWTSRLIDGACAPCRDRSRRLLW